MEIRGQGKAKSKAKSKKLKVKTKAKRKKDSLAIMEIMEIKSKKIHSELSNEVIVIVLSVEC